MLSLFLACSSGPTEPPPGPALGDSHVRIWRSPDLVTWTQDTDPLVQGFDTLGLDEQGGELRLVGLMHRRKIQPWEPYLPLRVRGFEGDGETWEQASWTVDDTDVVNFIDPQFLGDVLYFTSRSGGAGDPAKLPTEIRSSPPPRVWLSGTGLADPSAVIFEEEHHLFVTAPKGIQHHVGDPPVEEQTFSGFAVPFALVVGEELWLVAQGKSAKGRVPHLARYVGGAWTAFEPILEPGALKNCTSPVLHVDEAGGGLLICVEEAQGEGPRKGHPPSGG